MIKRLTINERRITNHESRTTNHDPRITVSFLGTNGWYDTNTGNTICVLIETPSEYVVLDAGNGIYKLDQYIKSDKKPIYLFISHFHFDHIIGFHIFAKFKFKQGLTLVIPKGTRKLLKTLFSPSFTLPLSRMPFSIKIVEVGDNPGQFKFLKESFLMSHPVPCRGYRFNFDGKIIAYVPDTGVCKNALKLAKEADLLLAECAFKTGMHSTVWAHLNPETAAQIAKKAGAKKLILVHFDAEIYPKLSDRVTAEKQARVIFKNSLISRDGMLFNV